MKRIGVLPGTFNPLTRAHVAMARSALEVVDEVVFALPREFPHKPYTGASLEERLEMLEAVTAQEPRLSFITTEGGLFLDIARELRTARGEVRLSFLCGRDAAERIVGWDYGEPGALAAMLEEFDLLVAARAGEYVPPAELAHWVERLPLNAQFEAMSATEVRRRIGCGEPWEQFVPPEIHAQVRRIYSQA